MQKNKEYMKKRSSKAGIVETNFTTDISDVIEIKPNNKGFIVLYDMV